LREVTRGFKDPDMGKMPMPLKPRSVMAGRIISICFLFVLTAFFSLSAGGCAGIMTARPIFDEKKDAVMDPRLLGDWHSADGSVQFNFVRAGGNAYRFEVKTPDSENPTSFPRAHLVPIGKYSYLFFKSENPDAGTMLFPCFRVQVEPDVLHLWLLNPGPIVADLHTFSVPAEVEVVNLAPATQPATRPATEPVTQPVPLLSIPNIIVADDPEAVRQSLIRHQDDAGIVGDPWIVHKVLVYTRTCPSSPKSPPPDAGPNGGKSTSTAPAPSAATSTSSPACVSARD
jgi:hypothetical protein